MYYSIILDRDKIYFLEMNRKEIAFISKRKKKVQKRKVALGWCVLGFAWSYKVI